MFIITSTRFLEKLNIQNITLENIYLLGIQKHSTDNEERSTIVIENKSISVLCRQIAGALARRIVTYAKLNADVNCGEELGL